MKFINFSKEKCKNCYKCIRVCSPKAISIYDDRAEILEDRCISCGECYVICDQNALYIKDKVHEVKRAIDSNKKVVASLSPSFPGAFSMKATGQMVKALKILGFDIVEEASIGGDMVVMAYEEHLQASQKDNLIATSCPSNNYLIETYYPELRKYMIPIVSPMIAHGKYLKQKYGHDIHVVFIGPCIAKKVEAYERQHQGVVDSVLTFVELEQWFGEAGINLEELSLEEFDGKGRRQGQQIPCKPNVSKEQKTKYERVIVTGISRSKEILESLSKKELSGIFLESASCQGGCIDGTGMPKDATNYYVRRKRVKDYIKETSKTVLFEDIKLKESISLSRIISDKRVEQKKHSQEEIEKVLKSMWKYKKEDELNCDACGYRTCREKAQSVLQGRSQSNRCLPFMRAKAESLKNVIFDHSPNAIFMVGYDLRVKEFNPSSERVFQIKTNQIKGERVQKIIPEDIFEKVLETKVNTVGKKIEYPQYGVILIANIIYLKEENILMAIMTDVTAAEKNKAELARVKENTLNVAQDVINKQMRVAQEIASLLGETTAETKVTLTKLKDIVMGERGEV
ncbi:putative PAS/PAC sensor protein [Alkaliphilus metalliredigens QYMF]|uniref:Putative PAS/PAC sensor protein n=1 Tax=Alkaliphilus metalliredigens (strain QYMF) TaxID=293826 RepID=A6TVD1_ALKMQ|nr:[Fe-Fe] hydrogenase large subunit C-terminal domain-containing protein [Alkaliphilus metalliredigens]ABR50149.1 putative PAS/PAC sensor protein [Alkaliphilus metalliredigens QYMF]